MYDFLTFKTFIAPSVLIIFYYIGALIIPLIIYFYKRKILRWLGVEVAINWRVKLLSVLLFFFMELIWRLGFEMLIGYFQMHNTLTHLS